MFLKGLRDTLKIKSGRRYLQKKMEELPTPTSQKKGITRLGCIVDVDHVQNVASLHELTEAFALKPNAVKIMGYTREATHENPYAVPLFSDTDLGWKGAIHNGNVAEFLKWEYDVLINYYAEDYLLLKLLSVKTSARLKVGLGTLDPRINDLILHIPLNDFNGFKRELKKYLNVLNEL